MDKRVEKPTDEKARISQPVNRDERRDEVKRNEQLLEKANNTAHQTADEKVEEVQGKLAVPYAEVEKRGSTKFTDKETGTLVKITNDEEPNAEVEQEEPEYLKLHREVVEGADPLEATLKYQKSAEELTLRERAEPSRETRDAKIGSNPRTREIGQGPQQTAEVDREENE